MTTKCDHHKRDQILMAAPKLDAALADIAAGFCSVAFRSRGRRFEVERVVKRTGHWNVGIFATVWLVEGSTKTSLLTTRVKSV